jgi:hypothetical protein
VGTPGMPPPTTRHYCDDFHIPTRLQAFSARGAKDSSDPDGDARGFRTQPPATLASRVGDGELGQVGVESIGLGGDDDGMSEVPVGLEDVSRYPTLFAALLERGWSVTDCTKLAGQNILRVIHEAESVAKSLAR